MLISPEDRVAYFGRTNSGKTTAAKANLRGIRCWTVLDPKHRFTFPEVPIVSTYNPQLPRQIVRVPFDDELYHWQDTIDAVWRRGQQILYIDELTLVNPSPRFLTPELGKAVRTGRERGLGVWFASQRPSDIPSGIFTETEHFFVFQLQYERDRKKVTSFTTDAMLPLLSKLKGHEFAYYGVHSNKVEHRLFNLKGRGH